MAVPSRAMPRSSKMVKRLACPRCRQNDKDRSGNNLTVYDDGHSYCFSCNLYLKESLDNPDDLWYLKDTSGSSRVLKEYLETMDIDTTDIITKVTNSKISGDPKSIADTNYSYQYLGDRGISRETMEFYGVLTKVDSGGKPLSRSYPFGSYQNVRVLPKERFYLLGDSSEPKLFGQDKFNAGSATSITITEGPEDAMSIYECFGRKYPSVSVRSASVAGSDCSRAYHYLNSFERIYICFDNDEPGMAAAKDVANLFDVNKVYHVKLDKWKDANEALLDSPAELRKTWYGAKRYEPKGVVSSLESFRNILEKEDTQASAHFPFPTLDSMAYGIRTGEVVLFTAPEKVGKTEALRAIEHHLLKTTTENIGIIHLEEQEKRSVQGLIGYELGIPVHLPGSGASLADQQRALEELVKTDGRLHVYSHYGSDDPNTILDIVRYLAAVAKCKYIFFDHITMLVTGFEGDDERKKLDYISTRLAMLTKELDFTLFMVSHVNDQGETRGSRNIAKVADLLVHLERDVRSGSNLTSLWCRGNRFGGLTGPAGTLRFDRRSFKVEEVKATLDPTTGDIPELEKVTNEKLF